MTTPTHVKEAAEEIRNNLSDQALEDLEGGLLESILLKHLPQPSECPPISAGALAIQNFACVVQLFEKGGCLVTTAECSAMEIAVARAAGRMFVFQDATAVIRRPQEFLDYAKESNQLRSEWTSTVPSIADDAGAYWWWNGDEDSAPIHIEVMYSPTSLSCFAPLGQWGWNRPQGTREMGGMWMRLVEPQPPEQKEKV